MSYSNTSTLSIGFSGSQHSAGKLGKARFNQVAASAKEQCPTPDTIRNEAIAKNENKVSFSGKWAWYFPY